MVSTSDFGSGGKGSSPLVATQEMSRKDGECVFRCLINVVN